MDKDNSYLNFRKNCKVINISEENLHNNAIKAKSSRESIFMKGIYLYGWGKNKYGELGLGTLSDIDIPSPITSLESKSINIVASGGRNSIILYSDGDIYLCGSNIFGLLALNSKIQNNEQKQKVFKSIKYFKENGIIIKEVSIAEFHCLALDKKGKIFGWGGNLFNKLGRKFDVLEGIPNPIFIKEKIKSISCGDYHSCAINEEGFLYSWGGGGESYNKGQCGHGTLKDIQKPKKVEFFIKNNIKIKRVSCGGYHTIVIANSDELFSFGKGIYGQCGYGQPEDTSIPKKVIFEEKQNIQYENNKAINIIDIKCGGEHSLFLSSNNNVYTCGHGYLGQLGLGNNKNINKPTIVQSLTNKKIIEISAGWSHSLVLSSEGNIYSTGCNKYGELGIGKDFNKYNYTWIKSLSNLNIKHISAGGHHSWCLIDLNNPIREDVNNPEPLLKSNFSMVKKLKRKLSEGKNMSSNNTSFNESKFNKRNNTQNRSSVSADNIINRRNNNSVGNDFEWNIKEQNSQRKIKKFIDDYNNNDEDMTIDQLIENINNIDNHRNTNDNVINNNEDENEKQYFINSNDYINNPIEDRNEIKNQNNNNNVNSKNIIDKYYNYNNKYDDEDNNKNNILNYSDDNEELNVDCELKIVYSNLDLSHRFIRFQSSIDYKKLNYIIKNNFLDKDLCNISYKFQKDDEIEKNNSISQEINFIFNKMKKENLINLDELSKSYTLGIVYDYNKNKKIQELKQKIGLSKIDNEDNDKGPFYGIKNINSKQIINSENEKILSKWIIDFCEIFNHLIDLNDNNNSLTIISFFELRPKIFKFFE